MAPKKTHAPPKPPVSERHPLTEEERKELARDLESLAEDPSFAW